MLPSEFFQIDRDALFVSNGKQIKVYNLGKKISESKNIRKSEYEDKGIGESFDDSQDMEPDDEL